MVESWIIYGEYSAEEFLRELNGAMKIEGIWAPLDLRTFEEPITVTHGVKFIVECNEDSTKWRARTVDE